MRDFRMLIRALVVTIHVSETAYIYVYTHIKNQYRQELSSEKFRLQGSRFEVRWSAEVAHGEWSIKWKMKWTLLFRI